MPENEIKRQETCSVLPDHGCKGECFGENQIRGALVRLQANRVGAMVPSYDGMLELIKTWEGYGCPHGAQLRRTLSSHYHEFSRRGQSDESST